MNDVQFDRPIRCFKGDRIRDDEGNDLFVDREGWYLGVKDGELVDDYTQGNGGEAIYKRLEEILGDE